MEESNPDPRTDLTAFYYLAEDCDQVDEREISPSLHTLSQITSRYEFIRLIAKGGMKQVFRVHDTRCKRDVAMATLHDDAPPELYDPLIHEAWLTAQLDHPNIIAIHDVGVNAENRPYFTMDLKSGDSLRELIDKLNVGDAEARNRDPHVGLLPIFVKICDAIAYAHSVQILHLDLKPANIQVGEYGEVLVCDWGLGRMLRGEEEGLGIERLLLNADLLSSDTLFGEVRGTPGYMAPEQIEQDRARDTRTDIYQLGCILYSMLTLDCPVEGEPGEVVRKALWGEIIPPSQRAPEREVPSSLEAVVLKAMALDPEDRYPSAMALGDEVRRYLTGFATQAENAGVLTQLGLLYKRNKRLCVTAGCLTAAMLCLAAWSYGKLAEKERAASAARFRAERTLGLYEAGRSELEKLSSQNSQSVERAVIGMHLDASESMAEQLLVAALEADPTNPAYLRAMGEHYFIVQRFNQATPYLDRGEKRDDADQLVADLAHDYAAIKPNDDSQLTTDQMVDLLGDIKGFDGLEAMIVLNDYRNRVDPNQRAAIIEEHLRSINPEWRDGWFEYDFAASRLRVGGPGFERLADSGNIVAGLQPTTLDISGSDVRELWSETGYAIETLDIRGCPIEGLDVLRRFVHLKTLIVHPRQFTAKQLAFLPGWVKVVEKKWPAEIGA